MNRLTDRALVLLGGLAVAVSVASGQPSGTTPPSYEISYPNYQYEITVPSLQDADFRNLTACWHRSDLRRSVQLRNGTFQQNYDGGSDYVAVDLIRLFKPPGATEDRAVIDILWRSCGGSCSDNGLLQVFELRSGHPTVVEQIRYGRHAPNTGAILNTDSRILTITGRSSEPSPNCCPRSLDVMDFEWDGKEFHFKSSKRVALPDAP